jgi:L-2-hydroxyglutarate oxidase
VYHVAAPDEVDLAVVGGRILGLATARELVRRRPQLRAVVLEREPELASHQTGRNSGVIHAGIYYAPGSQARTTIPSGPDTVRVRELYEFCEGRGIPHERCGKVIVARDASELGRLDELERRGRANEVPGLRRLDEAGLSRARTRMSRCRALHSPHTGIVDFAAVARALADELDDAGTPVLTGCEVTSIEPNWSRITLRHARGETRARFAVLCAGGWSDRLARRAGGPADPRTRGSCRFAAPTYVSALSAATSCAG